MSCRLCFTASSFERQRCLRPTVTPRDHLRHKRSLLTLPGSGKTIIVTGANTGLGKEAARHFVRLGAAKVILGCRSTSKGEEAKRDIEQSTARKGIVDVWALDLADYASVQAFAKRAEGLERLDVVLENAGLNTAEFRMVAANETQITVR